MSAPHRILNLSREVGSAEPDLYFNIYGFSKIDLSSDGGVALSLVIIPFGYKSFFAVGIAGNIIPYPDDGSVSCIIFKALFL